MLGSPDTRRDVQTEVRPIKRDGPFVVPVIEHDLEATARRNQELMAFAIMFPFAFSMRGSSITEQSYTDFSMILCKFAF